MSLPVNPVRINPISISTAKLSMRFQNPLDKAAPSQELGIGTSFFWKHNNKVFLVTNKHNVTGKHHDTGQCISKTGGVPNLIQANCYTNTCIDKVVTLPLYDFKNDPNNNNPLWLERQGLDIAAIEIKLEESQNQNIDFVYAADFEVDAIIDIAQDVFVIGYPKGIHIENLPIWKRATIASELGLNAYNNQPTFLIDTATREGMSGSPVFALVRSPYTDSAGSTKIQTGGNSMKFLGIYSGRLGANEFEAQLGIVWKKEAINQLFI